MDFTIEGALRVVESEDEISFKILRNLPYARRGMCLRRRQFRNTMSLEWYQPNVDYNVSFDELTVKEKKWLKKVKDSKWD